MGISENTFKKPYYKRFKGERELKEAMNEDCLLKNFIREKENNCRGGQVKAHVVAAFKENPFL